MKTVGFVRKVDELGRIVLPVEMRRALKIENNEELKITVVDDIVHFMKKDVEIANEEIQNSTIIRKTDELGRIVIPQKWRELLDIKIKDPVEIIKKGKIITLKKYIPSCIFCGKEKYLNVYKDKKVCNMCIGKLNKIKSSDDM